jgi:hypothetical protein
MEHWISSRKFPGCQTERWEIQRFFSGVKRLAVSVNGQCSFFFSKKFPLDVFYSILQILHRNNIQKKTLEIAMLSTCDNFGKILGEKCLEAQLDLELHSQDQSAVCPIFRETYPLVI